MRYLLDKWADTYGSCDLLKDRKEQDQEDLLREPFSSA